jgi:hypothetical protein
LLEILPQILVDVAVQVSRSAAPGQIVVLKRLSQGFPFGAVKIKQRSICIKQ